MAETKLEAIIAFFVMSMIPPANQATFFTSQLFRFKRFIRKTDRLSFIRKFDIFFSKPLKEMSKKLPTGVAPKHMKNENEKSLKGVQCGENVSDSNGGVKNAKNTNKPSRTQNE